MGTDSKTPALLALEKKWFESRDALYRAAKRGVGQMLHDESEGESGPGCYLRRLQTAAKDFAAAEAELWAFRAAEGKAGKVTP
jgi:hypothetical protein